LLRHSRNSVGLADLRGVAEKYVTKAFGGRTGYEKTMEEPDKWARLLAAANRGDTVSYAAFLRAAAPVVRGIVRAKAGGLDLHSREDIVQNVMLAIHLKRHTWNEDRPLRPWLYAIARHKIIDALRRHGSETSLPIDDMAENIPADADPDPFEATDVERTIARLDMRSAGILRAIAFEGISLAGIAPRLGITEGAARVALHRALRKLAALRAGDRE
jgi:RNA polymerase sigma-70 factor (ECF subfamily)